MLGGKIHRATVTQADLNYVGFITIDTELMASADIVDGEQVLVVDITTGARIITYVITGATGSGVIGINGAAAHLISPGNLVIIMSFLQLDETERTSHLAKVVHPPTCTTCRHSSKCTAFSPSAATAQPTTVRRWVGRGENTTRDGNG